MAKEARRPRDDDEDDEDDKPRKKRRAADEEDDEDDKPRKKRRDDDSDAGDEDDRPKKKKKKKGGGAIGHIIPYKNGAALAAYYCGVFGLIPIGGLLLGPLAAVLGILGFAKARNMPQATGIGHAVAGIIFGVVDTFVWQIMWMTFLREMSK